jgi:hypothetical protein
MAESSLQVIFPAFSTHRSNGNLQDRLREHAEAFDGLLSLIPAKHYYGEDNSVCDQPLVSRTHLN